MADAQAQAPLMRKTRIVCISDTHNQTPKLPKGDVLIHAGDITNQGSFSELKKMVEWLEKADFEAKIVIAGNHDKGLDAAFCREQGDSWQWTKPQDPVQCRKLFEDSPSITYLENQAASIYLNAPAGPHTCFKVFGSPYSPNNRNWAFKYEPEGQEASRLWDIIPPHTDIVVTHTPPKGHGDAATKDDRCGCGVLLQALHRVRPLLSVYGHIHEAHGVEIVQWNVDTPENGTLEEGVQVWKDPGIGTNKQSLVNVSAKGGHPLNNYGSGALTRCRNDFSLASDALTQGFGGQSGEASNVLQPGALLNSTSPLAAVADSEAKVKAMLGGAIECRQAATPSDIGLTTLSESERKARRETVMVNAAFLGPRIAGKAQHLNKPIVVDIDLPVWES